MGAGTLLYFTDPEANETIRCLGKLLFDQAPGGNQGPVRDESATRSKRRAALAELRLIQGFLVSAGEKHVASSHDPGDADLSRFAAREALEVGEIADLLEKQPGPWRAE